MQIKNTVAAILETSKKKLVVEEVELPESLDYGQVLVRVYYSGICGSQIGEINGVKGPDAYLPHLLGHEGAGLVKEIGPNVKYIGVGDKVVMHWRPGKGIESRPPRYKWRGKDLNAGYVTTFNEYAIVSENRLTPLPADYPLEYASLYGCALTTGLGVIENNAQLRMGESIVVVGAGGVGLNIIQGAKLHTAHPIVAVDQFDNRLELAERLGATHLINSRMQSNWLSEIKKILGESGADVVIDNTGNPSIIAHCYELTKSKGRTILVGVPPKGQEASLYTLPLHFGKLLTGSHGGNGNPTEDIPRYLQLEKLGHLRLEPLFTERFSL